MNKGKRLIASTEIQHADLLGIIESFLSRTGLPWSRFGRTVARDPRLVGDMRLGRHPRPENVARILDFIDSYGEAANGQA